MIGSFSSLGRVLAVLVGLTWLAPVGPARVLAQTADTLAEAQDATLGALRAQIESRYQVRSLRDGVLLLPSYGNPGVQTIELTSGEIALDGRSVTGAELRERVPEDAEAILRLSYLDPEDLRILFGIGGAPLPGDTTAMAEADTSAVDEEEEDEDMVTVESTDDRVRVGASIHVRPDEVVNGDVVAVLGSVRIDGRVTGDVVSVMGSTSLGPNAVVEGEVVVVGGSLDRAPGARIEGSVEEVAWGGPNVHVRGPEFRAPFLEGDCPAPLNKSDCLGVHSQAMLMGLQVLPHRPGKRRH